MPRLEDVRADLARAPRARAAALAGFDGLLVDEAFPPPPDDAIDADPPVLDGAIVELTHAWAAVRRATAEFLGAGEARELVVHAEGGLLAAHVVAGGWFALLWAAPSADPEAARAAVREAAERLAEVVG